MIEGSGSATLVSCLVKNCSKVHFPQMIFIFTPHSRFVSSSGKLSSLQDYVSRMKDKQETIFYMAGSSKEEVEQSPFVERLLKKGYEVLYLTEAVDEYAISALPEFEGKKSQKKPAVRGQ
jgi:HSP90 family molecular chaperone